MDWTSSPASAVSRRVRVAASRVADSSGVSAAEQQRREGCGPPEHGQWGNAAGNAAPEVYAGPGFRVQRGVPQWFETKEQCTASLA